MKKVNNKGFTIIEVVGIIVILAAVFLVAFPSILNIMKKDEEKLYTNMVDDLCLAGESYVYSNLEKYKDLLSTGNSKIYLNISYLVQDGSVKKDKENPKTKDTINNDFLVFNVSSDKSLSCEYVDSVCMVTNDVGTIGTIDFGDEVTCGTESFYVLPDHELAGENTVSMLAKYNLNVGVNKYPNENTFGIQEQNAKAGSCTECFDINNNNCKKLKHVSSELNGKYFDCSKVYGWTTMSDENVDIIAQDSVYGFIIDGNKTAVILDDDDEVSIDDEKTITHNVITEHLFNYSKYLSNNLRIQDVNVGLVSKNQVESDPIKCDLNNNMSCNRPDGFNDYYAFWTGYSNFHIYNYTYYVANSNYGVTTFGPGSNNQNEYSGFYGVRPMIIISKDEIKLEN